MSMSRRAGNVSLMEDMSLHLCAFQRWRLSDDVRFALPNILYNYVALLTLLPNLGTIPTFSKVCSKGIQ